MKSLAAFLFAMMLLFSTCAAEDAFVPPLMPEFSGDYGMYEYYTELEAKWGHPTEWSLEARVWFSSIRQKLNEMEYQHANARGRFLWWEMPAILTKHTHGLPDEKAITQEAAFALAKEHLANTGIFMPDLTPENVHVSYLTDYPSSPTWLFSFYNHGTVWVMVNARTGEIAQMSYKRLVETAREHVLSTPQPNGKTLTPEQLDYYVVLPYYDAAAKQWTVVYWYDLKSTEIHVTINDTTQKVLAMEVING